jgi:hypothetical protein
VSWGIEIGWLALGGELAAAIVSRFEKRCQIQHTL